MSSEGQKEKLAQALTRVRQFTRAAYAHLPDASLAFARRAEINLPLWELTHIAWFQEYWCLRFPHAAKVESVIPNADEHYDSRLIGHAARWDIDFPPRGEIMAQLDFTLKRTLSALQSARPTHTYFFELALWHEAMHYEALVMSLHALGLPCPEHVIPVTPARKLALARDIEFAGGTFRLGASPGATDRFIFDNEKWAHDVSVRPFAMRDSLTTCGEYAQYLDATDAPAPRHWRRGGTEWEVRHFDQWQAMSPDAPACHVNADEAQAYCAWAQRRLPTEIEWEFACLNAPPADAFGTLWQWTASDFLPYPGFAPDPYAEYSQPWFDGKHRVLRGSSFVTHPGLSHAKFRNFYTPHRADVFVGFRTCAL